MQGNALKIQNEISGWLLFISLPPVSGIHGEDSMYFSWRAPSRRERQHFPNIQREKEREREAGCVRVWTVIFWGRNEILCHPPASPFAEAPDHQAPKTENPLREHWECPRPRESSSSGACPHQTRWSSCYLSFSFLKHFLSYVLKIVYGDHFTFLCSVSKSRMHASPI